jgi:sugar O-acyltransferase (sialic acid O-acetyltransferase NeuD family)
VSARVPLYVFGAGGHGKVVADAARLGDRYEVCGLLDDGPQRWRDSPLGLPVLGGRDALPALPDEAEIALGIGDNRARASLASFLIAAGRRLAAVVHPRACLGSGVRLGAGVFVGPLAVVHSDSWVGRGGIVNTAAVVEHDCRLGDFVHVSPRAAVGGGCRVGDGAHLGLGAVVLPVLSVGAWSVLGAGAVLVRALPDGETAVGVPARVRARAEAV